MQVKRGWKQKMFLHLERIQKTISTENDNPVTTYLILKHFLECMCESLTLVCFSQ